MGVENIVVVGRRRSQAHGVATNVAIELLDEALHGMGVDVALLQEHCLPGDVRREMPHYVGYYSGRTGAASASRCGSTAGSRLVPAPAMPRSHRASAACCSTSEECA